MRISEIMEADGGLAKQSAVIARLERSGGEVVAQATNAKGDVAKVGVNGMGKVYFVIYPDGTFDRFDGDQIVIYRSGFQGPPINDPKETARRIQQAQWEKEERQERAAAAAQDRKEQRILDKREKLRTKYMNVNIPPQYKEICDAASRAIDIVMNYIGPDLRSGLASYDGDAREEETTRYYDPLVILDLVSDRMYDFCNGHDEYGIDPEDCTPEQWKAFHELPIKIQLRVASPYAGAFDY
jgi:hypothetical protein